MELLYLWIKDFKNIQKVGFNFSPKYTFSFNPSDNILTVSLDDDRVIEDFFGPRISNLTAIIGKNGAGKSNLLEFIVRCYARTEGSWSDDPFIFVYQLNEKVHVLKHNSIAFNEVKNLQQLDIEILEFGNGRLLSGEFPFHSTSCIYYSNYYDDELKSFQRQAGEDYIDISTNWRAKSGSDAASSITDKANREKLSFRALELKDKINFISKGGVDLIDFKIPDNLILSAHPINSEENLIKELKTHDKLYDHEETIRKIHAILDKPGAYNRVVYSLYFSEVTFYSKYAINAAQSMLDRADQLIESSQRWEIHEIFTNPLNHNSNVGERVKKLLEFLKAKLTPFEKDNDYIIPREQLRLVLKTIELLEMINSNNSNILYYDWTYKDSETFGGLSSGEKSMLSFFSRLRSILEYYKTGSHHILLIDEAELGFHPEWQKNFIHQLVSNVVGIILPDTPITKIQIIITSHSPLIISDIPKEYIIFLDKNEDGTCKPVNGIAQETFGANIHTLYSDSFFLNDGLIGKFAKSIIFQVIAAIKGEELQDNTYIPRVGWVKNRDNWRKLIEKVGEPILRQKLQVLLGIDAEIEFHRNEITRLEGLKEKKEDDKN